MARKKSTRLSWLSRRAAPIPKIPSQTLATLCDTVLPKLISCKIRFKETETLAGKAL